MISFELYLSFCAAAAAIIAMPGPMVALILSNSLDRGRGGGFATVAGSASAMLIHLALVSAGVSALLAHAGNALFWIKWAGAAYLFALGVQSLLKKPTTLSAAARSVKSLRRMFVEAFLLSLTHPKTLIFYVAFFPLFVDAGRPALPQFLLLSATFFAIAVVGDSLWALAASGARGVLTRAGRWTNIVTGLILIAAALGLALMRKG
jgi:threonine/homoserine/homoserine lactone efflux protein